MDKEKSSTSTKACKEITVVVVSRKKFMVEFFDKTSELADFLDEVNALKDNNTQTMSDLEKKLQNLDNFFKEPCVLVFNKHLIQKGTFNLIQLQQLVEKPLGRALLLDKIYRQVECEVDINVKRMFSFVYQLRDPKGKPHGLRMNTDECLAKVADLLATKTANHCTGSNCHG